MNERVIFDAASEIPDPDRRRACLDQFCGGDVVLRARIEALLESHESSSQFLNVPAVEQFKSTVTPTGQPTAMQPNPGDAGHGLRQDDDSDGELTVEPDLSFLSPSSKPDSIGTLGHYEILQVLGQGAFGIVFKAFDEKLHRLVAIKVLNPQMAATSPPRKRFLREARSAAAIRHENIVQVYSVEEQPLPYLVMEYIDGQTLQQKLDGTGPLELSEILKIGRQLATGLAAAHAKGLIHRDIKPGNILLERGVEQCVKITDFGLARAADDASLTKTGLISGTPMYMAPEQANGAALDHRTDLFSLGSVLYVMASGRPPFRADKPIAVLKRVTEETPRPIQQIIPEVPDWLCAIITKLHSKKRGDRFQSAREIADVLANCEAQLKAHSGLKDFSLIPQAKAQPAGWWKWVAVVALVCPLLAFGLYAFTRPGWKPRVARNGTTQPPTTDLIKSEIVPSPVLPAKQTTPTPAIAPFDAVQAKKHQEAWAKQLGVPVDYINTIGMKFMLIPPGEFPMGGTPADIEAALKTVGEDQGWQDLIKSEAPVRKVVLTQPIYLGVHEVTQVEYEKIIGTTPSFFAEMGAGKDAVAGMDTTSHPVECVSWNDAVEFCAKLSQREKLKAFHFRAGEMITPLDGTGYRLPTQAEWEFACRAGTTNGYWSGGKDEDLIRAGWSVTNSGGRTHAVGELKANPFGLYDIHGNVWEWVHDEWNPTNYGQLQETSPLESNRITSADSQRLSRGGSWYHLASLCRSSTRFAHEPKRRDLTIGFRVALPVYDVK